MEPLRNPEKELMKDDNDPNQPPAKSDERGQWANKKEFILAVIGEIIGLGNVWRFPYLCFKNGGGAFLVPYILFLFTCGMPVFSLELSLGQLTGQGGITCWRKICPVFEGLAYGGILVMLYTVMYYIIILAWAFLYLFSSFHTVLPWASCNNTWNTEDCVDFRLNRSSNGDISQNATSSVEEYWQRRVLGLSQGIEEMGSIHWDLAGCLLLSWIVCYFCIWKGVKSSGKAVYVTATFPYVMMAVLLIRGVTLPGAIDGIRFYLSPDPTRLADPQDDLPLNVGDECKLFCTSWFLHHYWVFIKQQTQWSLCIGVAIRDFGRLNTGVFFRAGILRYGWMLGARYYSPIVSAQAVWHLWEATTNTTTTATNAFALCLLNSATSLVAGFAIFSVLGFMSYELGVDISAVAESGPGLAFIAYPRAVAMMPLPHVWAAFFFVMIIFLGLDSQFVYLEALITSISDMYPSFFLTGHRRKLLLLVVCALCFLIGLCMVTDGGLYVFQLFDYYACSGIPLIFFAMLESICIGWVYGADHFYSNITDMIGYRPMPYMKYCWRYITPCVCSGTLLFSLVNFSPLRFSSTYQYPWWGHALGLFFTLSSVIMAPLWFLYSLIVTPGTLRERLGVMTTPADDLSRAPLKKTLNSETCPSYDEHELCALNMTEKNHLN